jgi:hypothetical protein
MALLYASYFKIKYTDTKIEYVLNLLLPILRCDIPVVFQLQYRNEWEITVLNTTKCLINSVDGRLLLTTTCFGPQVAIIRLALLSIISTMCDYGIFGVEI